MDFKLELVLIGVADPDRAKAFYEQQAGFKLDVDHAAGVSFRVIQFTPPGSACSIAFGVGITTTEPGATKGLHLVVTDIEGSRAQLAGRGIDVSGVFHDAGGIFHRTGDEGHVPGPDPERRSYASFASFSDPDGNGWVLQEITTRLPGR